MNYYLNISLDKLMPELILKLSKTQRYAINQSILPFNILNNEQICCYNCLTTHLSTGQNNFTSAFSR